MKICAVILTQDEEKHIVRCLDSIRYDCAEIIVVDSGSTDRTCEIAQSMGARIYANSWKNYATQFNFGLAKVSEDADWVIRIDADEYLSPNWLVELESIERTDPRVNGVMVNRHLSFRGRIMHFGGSVTKQLRIFRNKRGTCENRWMDEHISVEGKVVASRIKLVDLNLNDLRWWTEKHIAYADREVVDALRSKQGESFIIEKLHFAARVKRVLKNNVYLRLPTTLRSIMYFLYRYLLLLGFLDGRIGFQFTFFQGFWYRMYVDARIEEVEELAKRDGCLINDAVHQLTGIDF